MSGLLWVCAAWLAASPVAAEPGAGVQEVLDGLVFTVPEGAEVTEQTGMPDGVQVVAVTHQSEVLLLTVYVGEKTPSEEDARSVHTEEVERGAAKHDPAFKTGNFRQRMLGRARSGREVRYTHDGVAHIARTIAAKLDGRTVVASWSYRKGTDPVSPAVLESLKIR